MIDGQESIQGKTTIGVFRLNDRKDLKERRRNAWEAYNRELIKKAIFLKLNNADGVALCDETLEEMKDEGVEFCGMFKYQVK